MYRPGFLNQWIRLSLHSFSEQEGYWHLSQIGLHYSCQSYFFVVFCLIAVNILNIFFAWYWKFFSFYLLNTLCAVKCCLVWISFYSLAKIILIFYWVKISVDVIINNLASRKPANIIPFYTNWCALFCRGSNTFFSEKTYVYVSAAVLF